MMVAPGIARGSGTAINNRMIDDPVAHDDGIFSTQLDRVVPIHIEHEYEYG